MTIKIPSRLTLLVAIAASIFCASVYGQSAADWNAYKAANGIDPSYTYNAWVAAGSPRGGGGAVNRGPSAADVAAQQAAVAQQQAAAAQKQREDDAQALTSQGDHAYTAGDYETAVQYFQDALEKTPDDSTIQDRIQKAKDQIAAKKLQEQQAFDQSKNDGLSQLRGLDEGADFDSGLKGLDDEATQNGNGVAGNDSFGLKTLPAINTDPMVVDARNVPSGLPKSVDDAIISGYSAAPPGVSDRVRKAFQAIATHDWKAARAWFQDALNHDPTNPGLKRLVDLADYTENDHEQRAAAASDASNKPLTNDPIPANADEKTYALTSKQLHSHEEWMKFINKKYPEIDPSKLPKDSDINFLFPGLPAIQAGEMNDYMLDCLLNMTENDPELKRISQPQVNLPQSSDANPPQNPSNPYELK